MGMNLHHRKKMHLAWMAAAMTALLTACHDDHSDGQTTTGVVEETPCIYVNLQLELPLPDQPTTRASHPNGGENGDGRLSADTIESDVNGLTVVVMNAARTSIAAVEYFSASELEEMKDDARKYDDGTLTPNDVDRTYQLRIPLRTVTGPRDQYTFVVVANKDLTNTISTSTVPATLYDYVATEKPWAWKEDNGTYSDFVMTNERFAEITATNPTGFGTYSDPFRLHVFLERMAARIDFDGSNAMLTDGQLEYDITGTSAKLYITDIRLFNVAQEPSYLLKRVNGTVSNNNWGILGEETKDANTVATNYVIEPHSVEKTAANASNDAFLTARYGNTRIGNITSQESDAAVFPASTYDITTLAKPVNKPERVGTYADNYFRLGYANENTFDKDATCKEYATGVLLRGIYVPATVYSNAEATATAAYAKGTDFWRFEPEVTEAGRTEASEVNCKYFNNEAAANGYLEKNRGVVTAFPGGVCYYYLWVRHSNSNTASTIAAPKYDDAIYGIMEYGIVRNNVYVLGVEGVTGPGQPSWKYPRDPEYMKVKIYVRKWAEVTHTEITV